ncbi:hypothetical protein EON81_04060 [bacterium]|nr:MAG: hypothetical protein EON81_04060 [bacterium]
MPGYPEPPALGLIFSDEEAAREIFTSWRADFGEVDEERALRIVAVRGIDAKNPSHYRLVIAPNLGTIKAKKTFMAMQRILTMTPSTTVNLDRFTEAYEAHYRFLLVPAFLREDKMDFLFELAIGTYEFAVRDAWEIGKNDPDGTAIREGDDIIVPPGTVDPPFHHLLAWREGKKKDG